ncbi:hypothetical protein BMG03_04725 [Thioclava nitratireducens]|uniref:Glycosyl transferase family 1 domain-containing protein n=1 Tax=Thioclava nitratireducens TaxID=1915078 RepID=A0ABM6IEJ4_9RHOB|nr:hypothetical protein BMG03_04725 [Thioclava nitratireducens]
MLFEAFYPAFALTLERQSKYISPAFSVPLYNSDRVVVVVHDLAFLDFPECYSRLERVYYRYNLFLLKQFSKIRIVAPSAFVKSDINERLGISADRISVISPYASIETLHSNIESETLEKTSETNDETRYILLVSNGHPRKNIEATILGFKSSALPGNNVKLLLVGTFEKQLPLLDDVSIEVRSDVSDEELVKLYKGAYGSALFSLNEGFGIPVLEAAMFGIPCVHSNVTGLHSFDLDGNLPKNVISPEDISAQLNTMLEQDSRNYYLSIGERIEGTFNQEVFDESWRELLRVRRLKQS